MSEQRILIVDDRPDVGEALRLLLTAEGYAVESVTSPAAALSSLAARDFVVALIDLNYTRDTTSGGEGLTLLDRMRTIAPELPIIVMTAWGTIEGAVEAMRRGARDYVQKPWDNTRLVATVRAHAMLSTETRRNHRLENENRALRPSAPTWLGDSPAMKAVLDTLDKVAKSDASVLVTGEHGTGKEVVARALHARSPRNTGPFIAVNAAGLPAALFESELFGHVKGAFTDARTDRMGSFEMAHEGTLFLDEIGDMPLDQQAKLLRTLQSGEVRPVGSSRVRRVDVRVVTATNVDLTSAVKQARFREDLLFRLNTIELALPPLRDRGDDIKALADLFLQRISRQYGRGSLRFSTEALRALRQYRWPGNVRELEHVIERAVLLASGGELAANDLRLASAGAAASIEEMTLEQVEALLIEKALARSGGNVTAAAVALGLSRSALYRRIAAYGIRADHDS
jgi:DNA-binding NtrC family response regulator